MKKSLIITIAFTGICCSVCAETFDAPIFFAVENHRLLNQSTVILPFSCKKEQRISWNEEYQAALNGLVPNSRVIAYSRGGERMGGVLGSPICFVGECRANYVALPVTLDDELEDVVVVSKDIALHINAVQIVKNESCVDVPIDRKNPHGFSFEPVPTLCHDIIGASGAHKNYGQTVSFGWLQENGWIAYHQFFRNVGNEAKAKKIKVPLQEVTYDTSLQFPIFEFNKNNEKPSLLWYQRTGIGPVARFHLRESSVDENGDLHWSAEYITGGQPCD